MSSLFEQLIGDHRIAELWREDEPTSWWARLAPGYLSEDGTVFLHETSLSGIKRALKLTTHFTTQHKEPQK